MGKNLTQEQFYKNVHDRCECVRSGEYTLSGEFTLVTDIYTLTDKYGFDFKVIGRTLYQNIVPSILTCTNPAEYIKHKFRCVHGDKYNYDKFVYVNNITKGIITCPIHNSDFLQTPNSHLRGYGCPECGIHKKNKSNTKSKEWFVEKARDVHGDKYTYDNVVYTKAYNKVSITCPVHNDFLQTPTQHLTGRGCIKCKWDKQAEEMKYGELSSMSYTDWGIMGDVSKHFDSFKAYVVICKDDNESFIKIGKTYNTVDKRLKCIPYKYSIHNTIIKEDPIEICKIEHELKTKLKSYRYQPQKQFGGQFECFSIDALHSGAIDELIKNYN